ncbi:MAG: hypothetical protein RLZ10_831 [Bacteroidota bacterium]|jgi:C1A family cysteine protease
MIHKSLFSIILICIIFLILPGNFKSQDFSASNNIFSKNTQTNGTLLNISRDQILTQEKTNRLNDDVLSFSLESYLPEIGDQGDIGSCVGWATTYYAFTLVKRIEKGLNSPVYSPLSTYNRYCYEKKKNPTSGGAEIDACLTILREKGSPTMDEYEFPYGAIDNRKKPYQEKLHDFHRLQPKNIDQIKSYLRNNCPVVIGMQVFAGGKGTSLNSKFLDENGVIKIENFSTSFAVAGHALCIVGYDDRISGGAFKIVNSWGKDWGRNGFCWIRYSDLGIVRCAYGLIPNNKTEIVDNSSENNVLKIINPNKDNYFIALGVEKNKKTSIKGWFYIPSGQSFNFSFPKENTEKIFYLVMDLKSNIYQSESKEFVFPISKDGAFDSELGNNLGSIGAFHVLSVKKQSRKKVFITNEQKLSFRSN